MIAAKSIIAFGSFVVAISVMIATSNVVLSHEIEDGFVERAVEVVIRDEIALVSYYFGANEKTLSDVLETWGIILPETGDQTISEDYRSQLMQHLAKELQVRINDDCIALTPIELELSPKHHFDFVAKYQFTLPGEGTVNLDISDSNFQEMESAARFSLKALGSTIVSRTNVAPILIRSRRHELNGLTRRQQIRTCKITATVVTSTSDESVDPVH